GGAGHSRRVPTVRGVRHGGGSGAPGQRLGAGLALRPRIPGSQGIWSPLRRPAQIRTTGMTIDQPPRVVFALDARLTAVPSAISMRADRAMEHPDVVVPWQAYIQMAGQQRGGRAQRAPTMAAVQDSSSAR